MPVCSWPISLSECGEICEPLTGLPASGRERIEEAATEWLWRWTGGVYGLCPVTVRPCRDDCYDGQSTYWGSGPYPGRGGAPWTPVLIQGTWYNIGCGRCGDKCSCGYTPSLHLPGPIDSITEVVVDGSTLPASGYRVDNHRYLIRTDGGDWPVCQDMSQPTTAPDTFAVSYLRGVPVPVGGQIAAGVLACELAKMLCDDRSCRLPSTWTSVTRQGVTIERNFADNEDLRVTGIWIIDSWISSITDPPRPGRVFSVDRPRERARVTTWPV